MAAFETVRVHRRGHAATVELNRADRMNAWNTQLALELRAALEQAASDEDVRAVCITGAGRAFCAGADLRDLGAGEDIMADRRPDVYKALTERDHPIITAIRTMAKPVVAAVNGAAIGIGLSLALAADIVIAKDSAYFLLGFANVGLVPDGGSSLFVPERVGLARANAMAMLGEPVPDTQAVEWGLINYAVRDEAFANAVDALVDRLAAGPTRSYAGTKRELNAWLFERIGHQLELEAQIQREMAGSDDFLEGVTAFIEKRKPTFRGR